MKPTIFEFVETHSLRSKSQGSRCFSSDSRHCARSASFEPWPPVYDHFIHTVAIPVSSNYAIDCLEHQMLFVTCDDENVEVTWFRETAAIGLTNLTCLELFNHAR